MIERLLLDRIDLQRRRRCVSQAIELSTLIHANITKAALPLPNVAMPRAKITVHTPAREWLPPAPFVEGFGLLEYFQIMHGGLQKGEFLSIFNSSASKYTLFCAMPFSQESVLVSNMKYRI